MNKQEQMLNKTENKIRTFGRRIAITSGIAIGLAFGYGATQVTEPEEAALGICGALMHFGIVAGVVYDAQKREEQYIRQQTEAPALK